MVALALALFAYNKGLPLTLRSAFYPIFGEKVWGWPGHIVDTGAQDAALELQLFEMLSQLPLSAISSLIGIILVVVFFVTSSDSGSLVIDTIAAGGKTNAPVVQRVFWATFEGLIAIALLLGGGLIGLQAMAVSTGLPFTVVLLFACYAILKGLRDEPR